MTVKSQPHDHTDIRNFYDSVYYAKIEETRKPPLHLRSLARRLNPIAGTHVLDVGCGTGQWLKALMPYGVVPAGIDLSTRAVTACKDQLPEAEIACGPAEALPFADGRFGIVTCLGSLEHFLNPLAALREMRRVAAPGARFILLVPNAGFLSARLGFYRGTQQAAVKEEVLSLDEWAALFAEAGLEVESRWKDLHVLSLHWIRAGTLQQMPIRLAQALALTVWPLSWQYQVYHQCRAIRGN